MLDEAVRDAVYLSQRYITGRRLPDKAVGALDTACARTALGQRATPAAVEEAKGAGWDVAGPLPPDTVFFRSYNGDFDGVVAMYHDQGHTAVKLVAFEDAVNVTLGLPIVRTSVDHGTAFDIAGKGLANEKNMLQAIRLGAKLARRRTTGAVQSG